MPIQSDPFLKQFNHWPACEETWNAVLAISNSVMSSPNDTPLWSALTPEQQAHLFTQWQGRGLNCGQLGHAMRDCDREFSSASGALNPDIRFSSSGSAWRQWQKRIKTFRLNAGRNTGKKRQKPATPPAASCVVSTVCSASPCAALSSFTAFNFRCCSR